MNQAMEVPKARCNGWNLVGTDREHY